MDALKNPILWMLMAICLLFNIGNYGLVFWLPTIIQSTGMQSPLEIAFLTAIPYGVACVVMNRNAAHAERSGGAGCNGDTDIGGGRGHVGQHAVPAQYGGGDGVPDHRRVRAMATLAMFWGLPGRWRTAAAGGIALINSAASLAGLIGPVLMGGVKQWTGSISIAVLVLAALMLAAALLILAIPKRLMVAGRCDDAGRWIRCRRRVRRPGWMSCCVAWRARCPPRMPAAADLVRNMGRMVRRWNRPWRNRRASIPRSDNHGV